MEINCERQPMLQEFLLEFPGHTLVLATKFGSNVSRHQKYVQWRCGQMNGIDYIILLCFEVCELSSVLGRDSIKTIT